MNDIIIEKPKLAFIPRLCRMFIGSTVLVRGVHLLKEAFVPFLIDMPILHSV
jgi:hypothetical protein